MALSYPIAEHARQALLADESLLRATKGQAQADTGARVALTTEWLTLTPAEISNLQSAIDKGLSFGFAQSYENKDGETVCAVTFWKVMTDNEAEAEDLKVSEEKAANREENTDDIYFTRPEKRRERFGRAIRKPRVKKPDPRQMDLFPAPGRPTPEKPNS
jgi:hypothetical protein